MFPSSSARKSGNGNYVLNGIIGRYAHVKDSDIFPAIVVEPKKGKLITPTGMKNLDRYSLVSVSSEDYPF